MKYNTILLAGLLPLIAAQSAVSGAAQPTGFTPGEKPTAKWSNSTIVAGPTGSIQSLTPSGSKALPSGSIPNPYGFNSKPSTEGLGIKAKSTTSDVSTSAASHVPYTPGAGVHFANSTGASFDDVHVYPIGTDASSGLAKPTNSPYGATPGTGHLPYTSGAPFANTITGVNRGVSVNANSILSTGTGIPSGFAKPSAFSNFTRSAATRPATTTGRLPFTSSKGLFFRNSTSSGFASATDDSSLTVASATGRLSTGISSVYPIQTPSTADVIEAASQVTAIPSGKPLWINSTTTLKALSSAFIPGTGAASIPTTISITIKLNETSTIVSSSASRLPTLSALPPYSNSTISATKPIAPTTFGTVTVPSTGIQSSPRSAPTETPVAEYYQCGGLNWPGPKICSSGMTCKEWNPYYHQCVRDRSENSVLK